ncbi:MAG: hypothetical protein DRQ10_07475 [Candidatus Hydrothermota bacterium]|nr:MAG: hypothetical protein DRQ10_07475 [Candidatus Hydrothermae bacterium]
MSRSREALAKVEALIHSNLIEKSDQITIYEDDEYAECEVIHVISKSYRLVRFKLSETQFKGFLKNPKNCDGVIVFVDQKDVLHVLLFELKTTLRVDTVEKAVKQIMRPILLINGLFSIAESGRIQFHPFIVWLKKGKPQNSLDLEKAQHARSWQWQMIKAFKNGDAFFHEIHELPFPKVLRFKGLKCNKTFSLEELLA